MNDHIQFARARNELRDTTDLRAKVHKFTLGIIDGEMHFRLRYTDPRASRNQIVNEVLNDYVERQRLRAEIHLGMSPQNPFVLEAKAPALAFPQGEDDYADLRASVQKSTIDVIDAIVKHRCLYLDPATNRNDLVCEILDSWATLQWHRSNMTLEAYSSNPHIAASEEVVAHG